MDAYEPLEEIGEGSFGKVFRIRRKRDGKILVWKELQYQRMSVKERELLVNEVNLLHALRHPFVVRLAGRHCVDRRRRRLYVVMEHCAGGDLAALIADRRRRRAGGFPEAAVKRVASRLLLALGRCHGARPRPILHRDLKPANVLFGGGRGPRRRGGGGLGLDGVGEEEEERGPGRGDPLSDGGGGLYGAKLADFGLARRLRPGEGLARTHCGTPYYMAPEIANGLEYNEKSDIWSLGCVLYEMIALRTPCEAPGEGEAAAWARLRRGAARPLAAAAAAAPGGEAGYGAGLLAFVERMLRARPEKRPSVEELQNDPEIRLYVLEDKLLVKEHALYTRYGAKKKDLERREKALCLREAQIKRKEKELEGAVTGRQQISECGSSATEETHERANDIQHTKTAVNTDDASKAVFKALCAGNSRPKQPCLYQPRVCSPFSKKQIPLHQQTDDLYQQKDVKSDKGQGIRLRFSSRLLKRIQHTPTKQGLILRPPKKKFQPLLERNSNYYNGRRLNTGIGHDDDLNYCISRGGGYYPFGDLASPSSVPQAKNEVYNNENQDPCSRGQTGNSKRVITGKLLKRAKQLQL